MLLPSNRPEKDGKHSPQPNGRGGHCRTGSGRRHGLSQSSWHYAEVDALETLTATRLRCSPVCHVRACCIHGRTPPCTEAILDAGIRQVYIGTSDPNPKVAGQGIQQLREAGVEVHSGKLLEKQCRDLNLIYNHWISNSLSPLLAGKVATTLDGFTATRDKQSKWITSEQARQDVCAGVVYSPPLL